MNATAREKCVSIAIAIVMTAAASTAHAQLSMLHCVGKGQTLEAAEKMARENLLMTCDDLRGHLFGKAVTIEIHYTDQVMAVVEQRCTH